MLMKRVAGPGRGLRWVLFVSWCVTFGLAGLAPGQIPGLPKSNTTNEKTAQGDTTPAPTHDNPEATVSAAAGPIAVDASDTPDPLVREKLQALLPQYPGVKSVEVRVAEGVVTLEGRVEDANVRLKVTDVARRVEGVSFVVNKMKTDAQVMTARDLAASVIDRYVTLIRKEWLVVLIAAGLFLASMLLARGFARYSEALLSPFLGNALMRSVAGSLLSTLIVLGGVLLALQVLELTQAVLSILGLAGVVGLAVGFAFRDIAENFIASLLLGIRRPFRIGDMLEIAGHSGVVKTLNTRATVLVTLDGKHVRIPNATMFKEIMVNSSASPSAREGFDVLITFEASTAAAIEAITGAVRSQVGILQDPPARVIVTGVEPSGVRLRVLYWQPSQGVDALQIKSDLMLKAKVALQKASVALATPRYAISVVGGVPIEISRPDPKRDEELATHEKPMTAEKLRQNLAHDSHVASKVPATDGEPSPQERVLREAEQSVSDEGQNLLANGKSE